VSTRGAAALGMQAEVTLLDISSTRVAA